MSHCPPGPRVSLTRARRLSPGLREDEFTIPTSRGVTACGVFRNYAGSYPTGWANGGLTTEQNGWQAIAVFDADANEIRIRSYRIDDTDADGTYDGTPADTADRDMDFLGRPPATIAYTFADARPASLDNCPLISNPDPIDTDRDGSGNPCDDDDGDGLLDIAETGTGIHVSPSDTGSDPIAIDSDGDRFDDGTEVALGSDPNSASTVPMAPIPALPAAGLGALAALLLGAGALVLGRRLLWD